MLALKLKGDNELKESKTKVKTKVWKDINEVVKASTVPKKLKWYEREMIVAPKGEKTSNR